MGSFLITRPNRCWTSIFLIVNYPEGVTILFFCKDFFKLVLYIAEMYVATKVIHLAC